MKTVRHSSGFPCFLAGSWAIAVAACLSPRGSVLAQGFTNVTAAAGITHNAIPSACPQCATLPQQQSGGAAAGDFDGDGWPDLYVTRYWDTDILYHNNHDGTFTDVTSSAFTGGIGVHSTNGAAWGDVNNDGYLDLAVTTIDESRPLLYINDGHGHFSEDGANRGFTVPGLPTTAGTSVSYGDYDGDGYLDMYTTDWRGFGVPSTHDQARLYHNMGAANPGHFQDVTIAAGVAMDSSSGPFAFNSLSFTPRFADLDRDGRPDLAVVSDGKTTRMFWNNGDGTFTNGTTVAKVNTGTNEMGFTLGDFNGDGLMDWFVTSRGDGSGSSPSGNRLYLNNGNRTFTDATQAAGVREGGWGWGAEALDFNNDGLLDIAHTNGEILAPTDQTMLFQNVGTRTNPQFVDAATQLGVTDDGQGRGLLSFDYNRDGKPDLFIVNFDSPPVLYRNDVDNGNSWLEIRTIGTETNRDGIGTIITVTPDATHPEAFYTREISGSSTYLSQSEMIAQFGLGQLATIGQVDVKWPSGYTQRFTNVTANQFLTVTEGLLADFNGDDRVDGDDLAAFAANYGTTSGAAAQQGDADRDGDVDGADFLSWQRQLGRTVVSGLSGVAVLARVPEPPVSWLAGAAFVATAAVRLSRTGRGRTENIS